MKHPPLRHRNNRPSGITLQRLQHLLDAYGADPERWPWPERRDAWRLLERSAEARARRDEAARLDALLDLTPAAQPSAELAARILTAAPTATLPAENSGNGAGRLRRPEQQLRFRTGQRNGTRGGPHRIRVWSSLAVAASLAVTLWGVRTLPPSRHELPADTIANLGVYTTPTDVLLQWPGVNILQTVPSVGCTESELGCPELNVSPGVQSQSQARERYSV
jgi:hypothetical protein